MPRFRPTIAPRTDNTGPGGGGNFTAPELKPPPAKKVTPVGDFGGLRPQTAAKSPLKTAPPARLPKPSVKPAQLPSTSGKTTVPARSVTPHPAPTPSRKPAAPVVPTKAAPTRKAAAVRATPAQSPQDQATAAVTAALAPLYAAQTTQATGQNAAIASLTKSIIAQLMPGAATVGGEYNQAIGQQTNLSNAAADSLRAANPNTQDQALLSAINAPQAQHDQLAGQNNAAFNGAAAVGQYVGGVLPMSSLQSQKLAAMGLAHQMPVIEGLRGQQALSAALTNQAADRAKIDAMRPDLQQRYTSAATAAEQKQQYLDMVARKFGWQKTVDTARLTQGDARITVSVDKFNATRAATAGKIDVQVSRGFKDGLAHNASGQVITAAGKPVQFDATTASVTTKPPSGKDIAKLIDSWKTGRTVSKTVRAPNPDANGNPVVKTVKGQQGQLSFQQSYKRLRAMGISDKTSRQYLQTAYRRGEQGRGWLTNEQRGALRRAGRQTYVGYFQGHAFIGLAQAAALRKGNNLPPGELVNGRYFIAPGY